MGFKRRLVLVVGPVLIVGASIALSRWARVAGPPLSPLPPNRLLVLPAEGPGAAASGPRPRLTAETPGDSREGRASPGSEQLKAACKSAAELLTPRLGDECGTIVRPPFVIAGDMPADELESWHRRTIGPAARAMAHAYFDVPPSRPITVLLFANEKSYGRYARELFGDEEVSVYGYYKPDVRTLVMNIATGGGTLVHELTHALIDFDFPSVPDWFNEGLASLHEQCRIRPDETLIDGMENWRLRGLQEAIQDGRLRPLKSLISENDFRGDDEGLNYAQARYLCLFMQRPDNPRGQDVLAEFYQVFRDSQADDPTGSAAMRHVFANQSWEKLDSEFRKWVMTLRQ